MCVGDSRFLAPRLWEQGLGQAGHVGLGDLGRWVCEERWLCINLAAAKGLQ